MMIIKGVVPMSTDSKLVHLNASAVVESFLHPIKEYEEKFLNVDPTVANTYRFIGLYRLLTNPLAEMYNESTWFHQLIIETEMARDNVIIDTVDQLDEYYDNFIHMLKFVNPTFDEEGPLARNIRCAFSNIYDAKGFVDEKE
jgi:hypothetical protein